MILLLIFADVAAATGVVIRAADVLGDGDGDRRLERVPVSDSVSASCVCNVFSRGGACGDASS